MSLLVEAAPAPPDALIPAERTPGAGRMEPDVVAPPVGVCGGVVAAAPSLPPLALGVPEGATLCVFDGAPAAEGPGVPVRVAGAGVAAPVREPVGVGEGEDV